MAPTTNARLAGLTYLFYIALGIANEVLMHRAKGAEGVGAKLVRVAEYAAEVRVAILLALLECFSAIVVGVALYAITREVDHELAMIAMICRAAEGIINAVSITSNLELLWLATARDGVGALDAATANTLGTFLLIPGGPIGACFFALGSAIFSFLLLRGRIVPVSLSWFGVFSSVLLVVGLPLNVAGFLTGSLTGYLWGPATAFAVLLGLWLVIKGVATRTTP